MIHAGIPDAQEQVEAMDRHVERMERLLGQEARGKCHWIRGGVGSRRDLHAWGIALGSKDGEYPRGDDGLTWLDRHELAHWMIDHLCNLYQGPRPLIMAEGWADSQSGYERRQLFRYAAHDRQNGTWVSLKDLILAGHPGLPMRAYSQGRMLVDYLLTTYGGPRFFDLYQHCTAHTFDADCRRHLGSGVDDLEDAYSRYIDATVAGHGGVRRWRLQEVRCGPGVDEGKWRDFVEKYLETLLPPDQLNVHFIVDHRNGNRMEFGLSGAQGYSVESYQDGSQVVFLCQLSGSSTVRRKSANEPWAVDPSVTSAQSRTAMISLRFRANDWIMPFLVDEEFEQMPWADRGTVTELTEFIEDGQPRLRVTIEGVEHAGVLPARRTMVFAIDQSLAPIRGEYHNPGKADAKWEYSVVDGRRIVRTFVGAMVARDGEFVNRGWEIKECKFGLIPPEKLTLAALGIVGPISRPQHPDPASAATPTLFDADWTRSLPWWIGGWILFCGFALMMVSRVNRATRFQRLIECKH
jgi:hypothetical protein